jgi:hypothetical protein
MTRDLTRDLQKRVQKLESQMACRPEPKTIYFYRLFLAFAIAQYLGNQDPHETPKFAIARAFRKIRSEFENAVECSNPTLDEMCALVASQLLAKFGVSPNDKPNVLAEAFERMEAGLCETYKELLFRVARGLGVELPVCLTPRGEPESETSADNPLSEL